MAEKKDVYSRVTEKIIQALEQGVRPWHKPWNAEHAAGKITRPLRAVREIEAASIRASCRYKPDPG